MKMKMKTTTTLRLEEDVFKALKSVSARRNLNMSDIVDFALLTFYLSDDNIMKDLKSALGEQFIEKLTLLYEQYRKKVMGQ